MLSAELPSWLASNGCCCYWCNLTLPHITKYSFCTHQQPHAFSRKLLIIVMITPLLHPMNQSNGDVWKKNFHLYCKYSALVLSCCAAKQQRKQLKFRLRCVNQRDGGREAERFDMASGSSWVQAVTFCKPESGRVPKRMEAGWGWNLRSDWKETMLEDPWGRSWSVQ